MTDSKPTAMARLLPAQALLVVAAPIFSALRLPNLYGLLFFSSLAVGCIGCFAGLLFAVAKRQAR